MNTLLIVALAFAAPGLKEKSKEAPTLVGVWNVESAVTAGQADKSSPGSAMEMTADGKLVLREKGMEIKGTYTSDPKKDPPEIDLSIEAGGAALTMPGIFKFDGDSLTVCLVFMGERPKKFESVAGSMTTLLTLRRQKKD